MKVYLLKNKIVISFSPVISVAIKVYVRDGQVLSDIYHERNVQKGEVDCGIPLFNSHVMGNDAVEHLLHMLTVNESNNFDKIIQYNDAQIEIYNSINASKSLSELFSDCGNLAWGIILNNYYGYNFHTVEYLARMKRRALFSVLAETPPKEKIINLLKKTSMLHGRRYEFILLSRCLKDNDLIEAYKHKQSVTLQELYLAYYYRALSGTTLLSNICRDKKDFLREYRVGMLSLVKLVKDSIRIGENIGIKKSYDIVMGCDCREDVKSLHDKWSQRLRDTTKYLRDDVHFEEPSLMVSEGIEFINSINKLITEGKEMEHCLASYKIKALNGESYVYKVRTHWNERVTVELGLSNGIYILKQAKGFRNAEPSNLALNYVHTWLETENKKLKRLLQEYEHYLNNAMSA